MLKEQTLFLNSLFITRTSSILDPAISALKILSTQTCVLSYVLKMGTEMPVREAEGDGHKSVFFFFLNKFAYKNRTSRHIV